MLKNNKGFMLAEVVITSTIVLTGLIALYTSFNKLYKAYETRSTYYNIDGYYASSSIIKTLINNGELNNIFSNPDTGLYKEEKNYIFLVKNTSCINISDCDPIDSLIKLYNINNVVIIEWTDTAITSIISKLEGTGINETFKDYLNDYVSKHYDFSNSSEYNYLVITEYKKDNTTKEEYNYSSIGLRWQTIWKN